MSIQLLIYSCDECLQGKRYRVWGSIEKEDLTLPREAFSGQLPCNLSWDLNMDFLVLSH